MAKPLVSDKLWAMITPLLALESLKPKRGRPRVPDRAVLSGILFVLETGIPWEMLPREMGCGSGMTCWRRLQEWQQAGIWSQIYQVLSEDPSVSPRLLYTPDSVRSIGHRLGGEPVDHAARDG